MTAAARGVVVAHDLAPDGKRPPRPARKEVRRHARVGASPALPRLVMGSVWLRLIAPFPGREPASWAPGGAGGTV